MESNIPLVALQISEWLFRQHSQFLMAQNVFGFCVLSESIYAFKGICVKFNLLHEWVCGLKAQAFVASERVKSRRLINNLTWCSDFGPVWIGSFTNPKVQWSFMLIFFRKQSSKFSFFFSIENWDCRKRQKWFRQKVSNCWKMMAILVSPTPFRKFRKTSFVAPNTEMCHKNVCDGFEAFFPKIW